MSPQNSNVLCNLENFLIWFGGMPRNETQTHVLCHYVLGEGLASFQALTHPSIMEKQGGLVSFLTWAHNHGRKGFNCAWAKGALNSMKCEDILQVTYHTYLPFGGQLSYIPCIEHVVSWEMLPAYSASNGEVGRSLGTRLEPCWHNCIYTG